MEVTAQYKILKTLYLLSLIIIWYNYASIKRRLRPRQPGRLSKVLKNVAEMQLNSQNPSPKKEKIYEV